MYWINYLDCTAFIDHNPQGVYTTGIGMDQVGPGINCLSRTAFIGHGPQGIYIKGLEIATKVLARTYENARPEDIFYQNRLRRTQMTRYP